MKEFMGNDFLLQNNTAIYLYENHAKDMPIYDYHSHLSAKDIAMDRKFNTLSDVWLEGDHYKWRAMRSNGVDEFYCTGEASPKSKFIKYAEMMPYTFGNPLYHWTHMELRKFFNINACLDSSTANDIWNQANEQLKALPAKKLIEISNVKVICTTDDPVDDLKYHKELKKEEFKVLPTFRPDNSIKLMDEGFIEWFSKLEKYSSDGIDTFKGYLEVLLERIEFFHSVGCRISDHGLDKVKFEECSFEEAEVIFENRLKDMRISEHDNVKFLSFMMVFYGRQYNRLGWAMQLHMGPLRNNSKRMFESVGRDIGFDSINDRPIAESLSNLLSSLDYTNELPRTILYSINPSDNEVIGTMIGNFQDGSIPGKIQFGSGWWFNDQKDGMKRQLEALGQLGLLSRFVGMLTDSRSLLSFTRHDYFRRILCNHIGEIVENGEYPNNREFLGQMVEDICYNNAVKYFNIEV